MMRGTVARAAKQIVKHEKHEAQRYGGGSQRLAQLERADTSVLSRHPIHRHAGRWSAYAAAGITIALSGPVLADVSGNNVVREPNAAQNVAVAPLSKPPTNKPAHYRADCHNPNDSTEYGSCAEAALVIPTWAVVYGLFLTLIATATAAVAAALSAKSAERAVKKSDELLAQSEEASERQLRAYLFIDQARVLNKGSEKYRLFATVVVKNGGQTPAYNVSSSIGIEGDVFPIKKAVPDVPPSNVESANIVGPQGEIILIVDLLDEISDKKMAALSAGKAIIWVTVRVDYIDVFNEKQWITGRFFTGGDSRKEFGGLVPYHTGNAASEQGQYQRRRRAP